MTLSPAFAENEPRKLDSPESAFGGGVGFTGLLHIDWHRWVSDHTSIELGLTPMLLHNVASIAVTQHIDVAPSVESIDHNLVVSGTVVGIANIGGILVGPGMRAGYELWTQRFGISLAAGPSIAIGGEFNGDLFGDARLTVWTVTR